MELHLYQSLPSTHHFSNFGGYGDSGSVKYSMKTYFHSHHSAGYFFLSLAAISFATTGQLLINANDPALKVIRDAIIFSHTGYGIIFLTYIFSNFILMLARNLPVYKVLDNPTRMPYFTYRFAGLIATLAFMFYSNWRDFVFNGVAGFYNTAGDLYRMMGNDPFAESFYEQGQTQGFQNNRSNYALATLKSSRFNMEMAHRDYERANSKRPTPYSLVNSGNLYIWENNIFEAICQYQHSYRRLEDFNVLENNLGFAYVKVHNLDSALIYLNKARGHSLTRNSAETNFFALAALEKMTALKIDSVLAIFQATSPQVLANAMALSTLQQANMKTTVLLLAEKQLNLYTATQLNNYCIKHAKSVDTTFISHAYAIASDSLNSDYSEALKASLAFAYYHQGNVTRALQLLAELAYISQSHHGKFNYIMGLWALEQRNPDLASSYFTYADTYDYKEARFYNAIALSEARKPTDALIAWDSLARRGTAEQQAIAIHMKNILALPASEALSLGDAAKYQFCRYRIGLRDSVVFNRLINTFENSNYKAQALLDLSQKYFEARRLPPAIRYFNRIAGLELSDKTLYEEIRHAELRMLAYRGDVVNLARQINKGVVFDGSQRLEKLLYTAMINESSGDTTTTRRNYKILSTYNPYFEEGIIASSNFFRKQKNGGFNAYNILAEAIQINSNSIRLLKAYAEEAERQGFDEYAYNARQRLAELEVSQR